MNPPLAAAAPFHPGRDLVALEDFAYRLLCEAGPEASGATPAALPRLRASALNPARLERSPATSDAAPSRTDSGLRGKPIPLAYEIWLGYLLDLDTQLHYLQFGAPALTALELRGLQALARARARFLRQHSFCPHCEAPNPRPAQRCARCHKEL